MGKNDTNLKPPSLKELEKMVGSTAPLLIDLMRFIEDTYQIEGDYKYSTKNGWAIFYRESGRSLCYLSLRGGDFTVTVVIGATLKDSFKNLSLSKNAKDLFNKAKQFHDGKWLHFDVKNQSDLKDIKTLLLFKKKPVKDSK